MSREFPIATTLFHHLASGGGLAWRTRNRSLDLLVEAAKLANAYDDFTRRDAALDFARVALGLNDADEYVKLMEIVAVQEQLRTPNYSRQREHTAHVVYLYLLGIWFYDNVPLVRTTFNRITPQDPNRTSPTEPYDEFYFQWLYAGLLHDVGYIFENLGPGTKSDRRKVDAIFGWRFLKSQLPANIKPTTIEAFARFRLQWCDRFIGQFPVSQKSLASISDGVTLICRLASVPWATELVPSWQDITDAFHMFDSEVAPSQETPLEQFALLISRDENGPAVDHAIASGLLLFRYTTYWYWIMNTVREQELEAWLDYQGANVEVWDYEPKNLHVSIAPACRATAYHNVNPSRIGMAKLTLEADPLLFLSIICDGLQQWYRPPVGSEYHHRPQVYRRKNISPNDISIRADEALDDSLSGQGWMAKAVYSIHTRGKRAVAASIAAALDEKLDQWSRLLRLES